MPRSSRPGGARPESAPAPVTGAVTAPGGARPGPSTEHSIELILDAFQLVAEFAQQVAEIDRLKKEFRPHQVQKFFLHSTLAHADLHTLMEALTQQPQEDSGSLFARISQGMNCPKCGVKLGR